jgi:hypothetical protein
MILSKISFVSDKHASLMYEAIEGFYGTGPWTHEDNGEMEGPEAPVVGCPWSKVIKLFRAVIHKWAKIG